MIRRRKPGVAASSEQPGHLPELGPDLAREWGKRIPGVGRATLYSTERSLRIWIDPAKLVGYGLSADDVNRAITAQNAQVASGSIGAEPSTDTQKISAQVLVKGQLS